MILKLVRTPGIYLVGFMGTGKSTVGQLLAERLGWKFADLDADIEAGAKISIAEIFQRLGEEHFRGLETDAIRRRLRQVRSGHPLVVAFGGGAFTRPENRELLEDNGVTVWLDCPVEIAWRRAESEVRPLARDRTQFEALYAARRSSYALAEFRIDTCCDDPQDAVEALCRLPIF